MKDKDSPQGIWKSSMSVFERGCPRLDMRGEQWIGPRRYSEFAAEAARRAPSSAPRRPGASFSAA